MFRGMPNVCATAVESCLGMDGKAFDATFLHSNEILSDLLYQMMCLMS